ncbi:MAG: nitrile hydratase accessory protein [Rhizobiaceae bacterium]|nr:nitrile hydratase accessory protein [Rhizobiaceae bacterium]
MNVPETLPGLVTECGEPVFNEPWEASAFALVVGLHQKGAFEWTEWADVLSETIKNGPEETPYYQSWLSALETIVSQKALIDEKEISMRKSEWEAALVATPHGSPIELENGK